MRDWKSLQVSTGDRESVIISQVYHIIHQVTVIHQISQSSNVLQIFRVVSNLSDKFKPFLLVQIQHLRAASCALCKGRSCRGELGEVMQ